MSAEAPVDRAQFLTASAAVAASAAIFPLAAVADEDTVRLDMKAKAPCIMVYVAIAEFCYSSIIGLETWG